MFQVAWFECTRLRFASMPPLVCHYHYLVFLHNLIIIAWEPIWYSRNSQTSHLNGSMQFLFYVIYCFLRSILSWGIVNHEQQLAAYQHGQLQNEVKFRTETFESMVLFSCGFMSIVAEKKNLYIESRMIYWCI